MNLSKTTEYALRIMSYMSLNENDIYTTSDLSAKLNIPYSYLRKQMNFLVKKELLISIQGKSGGYKIAKLLTEISLQDIVEANDEPQPENMCFFGFQDCPLTNPCSMHNSWGEIRDNTAKLLKTTTLQNIKNDNISNHLI